jgi:predicted P-loop ATPase
MGTSRAAIHTAAYTRIFDELKNWIDELPDWDDVKRLDTWLTVYGGADTKAHKAEYLTLVGSKYIMQVLNRALHPGAKADYSLVFTSLQGIGKDRVLEAMFAPYYREGVPSPRISHADFALSIAGAVVAHGAEMSAWRKSDVEEQKAVLTRCVDHGRRAYGYEARSYPRRACLAFSTNDVEFLQDATGNRRYWVVSVIRDRIDIEGLRRDRDQLLAETLARLAKGELHWPTPEEEERHIIPERQKYLPEAALEIRYPRTVHHRGAADDAAEPRGLRRTTFERAVPRRVLREMLRDVCGGQATGARPGVQEGHLVLHNMAPRTGLATRR